jgi:hypothetical protein
MRKWSKEENVLLLRDTDIAYVCPGLEYSWQQDRGHRAKDGAFTRPTLSNFTGHSDKCFIFQCIRNISRVNNSLQLGVASHNEQQNTETHTGLPHAAAWVQLVQVTNQRSMKPLKVEPVLSGAPHCLYIFLLLSLSFTASHKTLPS